MGRIPFDPTFTKAMVEGKTIVEYNSNSEGGNAVKELWKSVSAELGI